MPNYLRPKGIQKLESIWYNSSILSAMQTPEGNSVLQLNGILNTKWIVPTEIIEYSRCKYRNKFIAGGRREAKGGGVELLAWYVYIISKGPSHYTDFNTWIIPKFCVLCGLLFQN